MYNYSDERIPPKIHHILRVGMQNLLVAELSCRGMEIVRSLRSLLAPCRGGEGSARPGKALFLRRGTRGSESSPSQKAAAQDQGSQPRVGQGQAAELHQESLPHRMLHPCSQPCAVSEPHQKQRRHTEGSQPSSSSCRRQQSEPWQVRSASQQAAGKPCRPESGTFAEHRRHTARASAGCPARLKAITAGARLPITTALRFCTQSSVPQPVLCLLPMLLLVFQADCPAHMASI